VVPPRTPEEGYHLTEDLVDHAMQLVADAKQVAPDKPFFMYFCTGAMHAPHHVPKAWADRYKGQFDDGWDAYRERVFRTQLKLGLLPAGTKLSARDPDVQEWASLSPDEKRLYARMMEVFAGFLEHTDHHIGRLVHFLAKGGWLENTLSTRCASSTRTDGSYTISPGTSPRPATSRRSSGPSSSR
jgi:arylsulfatase